MGRAASVGKEGSDHVLTSNVGEVRGEVLFVATGRRPNVDGLDLESAGVSHSEDGIPVDAQLRTNVKHIYVAGDVTGGQQFAHLAGWQAFQAVRNALLPGSSSWRAQLVPWVTFTDPEVAHAGLTEEEARAKFHEEVDVYRCDISRIDRAICESDADGFIKMTTKKDGRLLGATVVNARAGEMISELVLAIQQKMKVSDLAAAIHPYPTYSTALQQLAADAAVQETLSGVMGYLIRAFRK